MNLEEAERLLREKLEQYFKGLISFAELLVFLAAYQVDRETPHD